MLASAPWRLSHKCFLSIDSERKSINASRHPTNTGIEDYVGSIMNQVLSTNHLHTSPSLIDSFVILKLAVHSVQSSCNQAKSFTQRVCGTVKAAATMIGQFTWNIHILRAKTLIICFLEFLMLQSQGCQMNYVSVTRLMPVEYTSVQCGRRPVWNETCKCSDIKITLVVKWPYNHIYFTAVYKVHILPYIIAFIQSASHSSIQDTIVPFADASDIAIDDIYIFLHEPLTYLIKHEFPLSFMRNASISSAISVLDGPALVCNQLRGMVSSTHKVVLTYDRKVVSTSSNIRYQHVLAPQLLVSGTAIYNGTSAATYLVIKTTDQWSHPKRIHFRQIVLKGLVNEGHDYCDIIFSDSLALNILPFASLNQFYENKTLTAVDGNLTIFAYLVLVSLFVELDVSDNHIKHVGLLVPLFWFWLDDEITHWFQYHQTLYGYSLGHVQFGHVTHLIKLDGVGHYSEIKCKAMSRIEECQSQVNTTIKHRKYFFMLISSMCGWLEPSIEIEIVAGHHLLDLSDPHEAYFAHVIHPPYELTFKVCSIRELGGSELMMTQILEKIFSVKVLNVTTSGHVMISIGRKTFCLEVDLAWRSSQPFLYITYKQMDANRLTSFVIIYKQLENIPMIRAWFDLTGNINFISNILIMTSVSVPRSICTQLKCYMTLPNECTFEMRSWEDMAHSCSETYNASLVSVNSFEEYHLILEIIREHTNYHTCIQAKPYAVIFISSSVLQVRHAYTTSNQFKLDLNRRLWYHHHHCLLKD